MVTSASQLDDACSIYRRHVPIHSEYVHGVELPIATCRSSRRAGGRVEQTSGGRALPLGLASRGSSCTPPHEDRLCPFDDRTERVVDWHEAGVCSSGWQRQKEAHALPAGKRTTHRRPQGNGSCCRLGSRTDLTTSGSVGYAGAVGAQVSGKLETPASDRRWQGHGSADYRCRLSQAIDVSGAPGPGPGMC